MQFEEYLQTKVNKNTYKIYKCIFNQLEKIGLEDREETYYKIQKMKSTNQNNFINVLNQYEKYLETGKRWKSVKIRVEDHKQKEDYLKIEDILKMIRNAKTIRVKAEIAIMFGTGLRVGELRKIRHNNIDGKNRKIVGVKAKGNKTTNSYFIDNYFYDILVDFLTWKKNNELYKNLCNPDNYVFCNSEGKTYTAQMIWKDIKSACKILEDKKSISPHTLRHSFVYSAMEKGIPQDAISKNLGHSSTQITEQVYTHYTQDLQQKRFFGNQNNNNEKVSICPNCGFNEILDNFILCPQCQHRFRVICDSCQDRYKVSFKSCPFCATSNPFYKLEKIETIQKLRKELRED